MAGGTEWGTGMGIRGVWTWSDGESSGRGLVCGWWHVHTVPTKPTHRGIIHATGGGPPENRSGLTTSGLWGMV